MTTKTIIVECEHCGYKKFMVVDTKEATAQKIIEFQEKKICPNCGEKHSLHIID